MSTQIDAFGGVVGVTRGGDPIRKPATGKRRETVPKGYAGLPGSGPDGETCGTCQHIERFVNYNGNKRWAKCGHRLAPRRTGGRGTDVLVRSAACNNWGEQP